MNMYKTIVIDYTPKANDLAQKIEEKAMRWRKKVIR